MFALLSAVRTTPGTQADCCAEDGACRCQWSWGLSALFGCLCYCVPAICLLIPPLCFKLYNFIDGRWMGWYFDRGLFDLKLCVCVCVCVCVHVRACVMCGFTMFGWLVEMLVPCGRVYRDLRLWLHGANRMLWKAHFHHDCIQFVDDCESNGELELSYGRVWRKISSSLVRNLHRQSGQQGESGCLLQIFTSPIQLCVQCCLRWPSSPPQAVMAYLNFSVKH